MGRLIYFIAFRPIFIFCLRVCVCLWGQLMHRCAPCLTELLTCVFCLLTVLDHWSGLPPSSLLPAPPSLSSVFLLFSHTFRPLLLHISSRKDFFPPNASNCDWHCIRQTPSQVAWLFYSFSSSDLFLSSPCLSLPPCPWRTGPQLQTQDVNRTVPPHSSSLTSFVCVSARERERKRQQCSVFLSVGWEDFSECFIIWSYTVCDVCLRWMQDHSSAITM